MPPAYCHPCKRTFKTNSAFTKHLEANESCLKWFVKRNEGDHGLSRPTKRTRLYQESKSQDEFFSKLPALLQEEKAAKDALNSRVFEFTELLDKGGFGPVVAQLYRKKGLDSTGTLCSILPSAKGDNTVGGSVIEDSNKAMFSASVDRKLHSTGGNFDLNESTNPIDDTHEGLDAMEPMEEEEDIVNDPDDEATEAAVGAQQEEPMVVVVEEQRNNVPAVDHVRSFHTYVKEASHHYNRLTPEWKASVELMELMNAKGGSLALYDAVCEWHERHHKTPITVRAEQLHNDLISRYNLGPILPEEVTITLPNSKEVVKLACHDAKAMIVDSLSDPRLTDGDYLWNGNDPTEGIAEEVDRISDVNTGRAYRATYKKEIDPEPYTPSGRRRVLLPLILYVDGCVTGQFQNLDIEIVKATLGIYNGNMRKEDRAWFNFGYIKKVLKKNKEAEDNIRSSGHVDSQDYITDPSHRGKQFKAKDGPSPDFNWEVYANNQTVNGGGGRRRRKKKPPQLHAQDWHAMVQAILASYKQLEDEGGFEWDLRFGGTTHRLFFVPFILFLKADGVEADKACGQYRTKLENVKCLCRYCCIPTAETDNPYPDPEPRRKTQTLILDLVKKGDKESLKKLNGMSQHPIWNTFYQYRFGQHNDSGIHGATPWECLHWIQLGWYKYNRECLFVQTGETSKLSKKLDTLATTVGNLLLRQSDRNLPRTKFAEGIRLGHMQAHEMTGAMLVLTLAIRCRAGRDLLLDETWGKQKEFFRHEGDIKDWIRMLELHLMFEQWLRQDSFRIDTLERAKVKLRELMAFTKQVGKRSKGMGYKTANFHGTIHMPEYALDFCAFCFMNTEINESHHKKDKATAKRTNKQMDSFDISHANKVVQRRAIELAFEEMEGHFRRWDYYKRAKDSDVDPYKDYFDPRLKGVRVVYSFNVDDNTFQPKASTKMIGKEKYVYDKNTNDFLLKLGRDLYDDDGVDSFTCYSTYDVFSPTAENNTQHFHAMPYSLGKPRNDWAMFDLSDPDSEVPLARKNVACQIKCFVDFSSLPEENGIMRTPGIYAIVEPTWANADPAEKFWSQLSDPICKKASTVVGFEDCNHQELVPIDTLQNTAIVVPDHANPNNRAFLRVVPMNLWASMFKNWINTD